MQFIRISLAPSAKHCNVGPVATTESLVLLLKIVFINSSYSTEYGLRTKVVDAC